MHNVDLTSCFTSGGSTHCTDPSAATRLQLVVDPNGWTAKSWTVDFDQAPESTYYETAALQSPGRLIDAAIDPSGDLWSSGEFARGIGHVHNGVVTSHDAPLGRVYCDTNCPSDAPVLDPVAPFAFGSGSTTASSSERIIWADNKIWFIQGGNFGTAHDHTRIVSFDPAASDNPVTQTDERMCAYDMPGDHNTAYGMGWDTARHRMWFTESNPNDPRLDCSTPPRSRAGTS